MSFRIPQGEGRVLAQLEATAKILVREFHGDEVRVEVQAPESYLRRLERFQEKRRKRNL
jgi:hypothetical protein